MSEAAQPEHSWCQKIFDELDPPDSLVEEAGWDIENESKWVQNVLTELMQQAMPAFCIRKPKGFSPRETGLYLGQQCANLYSMGEMVPEQTPEQIKAAEAKVKFLEQNRSVPGVGSLLDLTESLDPSLASLAEFYPIFEKALHHAFQEALDQPKREDAAEFFQGFAKGISRAGLSKAGLTGSTTATLIYFKLFFHRREVERLKNCPALRQFLIQNGVPENVLGCEGRLQKLIGRIGLTLGKRGRPSKKVAKMRHPS
jgi:hypothetical protein